jgi:hypothetical protein
VPEVVPEPDRLGEVLVQAQRAGHRPRDLRHLDRVRQARAEVVALGGDEDLRLVLEAAERLGVHDPVAVALQRRAQAAVGLLSGAARRVRARRQGREHLVLPRGAALGERRGHGARVRVRVAHGSNDRWMNSPMPAYPARS